MHTYVYMCIYAHMYMHIYIWKTELTENGNCRLFDKEKLPRFPFSVYTHTVAGKVTVIKLLRYVTSYFFK
jgi:hypothetical protein